MQNERTLCLNEVEHLLSCVPIAQTIYQDVVVKKKGVLINSIERSIFMRPSIYNDYVFITCKQKDTLNEYGYLYHIVLIYERFNGNRDFPTPG